MGGGADPDRREQAVGRPVPPDARGLGEGGPRRGPGGRGAEGPRGLQARQARPLPRGDQGFFGTLKQEFLYGRKWAGVGREEFEGLLSGYMGWYVGRRPRRFREGGRARYETLAEHRRRLGYPVPPFAAQQAQ